MAKWGVISTVKAPLYEVVKFIAHHFDMGASFFVIYLDEPNPEIQTYFAQDPDILIITTDADFWGQRDARPSAIEGRQIFNINHAINLVRAMRPSISWLAHIDIDEYLVNHAANLSISQKLRRIPDDVLSVQVKPIENLISQPGDTNQYFKALMYPWGRRMRFSSTVFPEFGDRVVGGFLSHKNGKSIIRINGGPVYARIHHVSSSPDIETDPKETVFLRGYELAHFHTKPWEEFERLYEERRQTGSYRMLSEDKKLKRDSMKHLWEVFDDLERDEGRDGIKRLHSALCMATPDLLDRLSKFHILRRFDMQFEEKIARYFPDFILPQAHASNAD